MITSKIVQPFRGLEGRAETTPDLVLYRDMLRRSVESFILHAWGLGAPNPHLWEAFAINAQDPKRDMRVAALDDAMDYLSLLRPGTSVTEELRAFQVVIGERGTAVRINHEVQGRLTARLLPDPAHPRRPFAQLQFDASPNDPDHAAQFLVLHWLKGGHSSFIVLWDVVPMIVQRLSAAGVRDKFKQSLPFGGPRERWMTLGRYVDDEEVVSAYFQEGIRRPNADDLALRALDHIERSHRVGQPSRKFRGKWVPLHDPNDEGDTVVDLEGERFGLKAPEDLVGEDVYIDLDRAMGSLDQKTQDQLRLYYTGHTDEEIGEMLGVTHQAVSKRRRFAIQKLRNLMSS